jgi:hypothetical protein
MINISSLYLTLDKNLVKILQDRVKSLVYSRPILYVLTINLPRLNKIIEEILRSCKIKHEHAWFRIATHAFIHDHACLYKYFIEIQAASYPYTVHYLYSMLTLQTNQDINYCLNVFVNVFIVMSVSVSL